MSKNEEQNNKAENRAQDPKSQSDESPQNASKAGIPNDEAGKEGKSVLKTDSKEKGSSFNYTITLINFGISILAIFLVLAVMKKVDNNISQLNSNSKAIEIKTSLLKTEMDEKFSNVDFKFSDIRSKVEKTQRIGAIMELKRALVTVQEVSNVENSPELQSKSRQLVSNIESFLQDLGETKKKTGTIEVKEAPQNVSK